MFKKMLSVGFVIAACVFGVNAATIQGVVIDQDSIPVKGATVTIARTGMATITLITDTTGSYSDDTLVNSTSYYSVTASKIGYVSSATQRKTIQGIGDIVFVNLSVTFRTLSGVITDSATTLPIKGAKITLKRDSLVIDSLLTDSLGRYSIVDVANADTVMAVMPYYISKMARLTIAAATVNITQSFALRAFGNLVGNITNDSAAGNPIAGAKIKLAKIVNGVTQTAFDSTVTDSLGNYVLDTLDAYIFYQISASKTGYDSKVVTLNGKTRGIDTVNLALATIRTITGKIGYDSTAGDSTILIPIKGAKVTLLRSGTPLDSMIVDSTGTYTFTKSAYTPGAYSLVGSALHFITGSIIDTVLPAQLVSTTSIVLVLAQGTISGTVTADSGTGKKLVGAMVKLAMAATPTVFVDSTVTDTNGAYSFPNLEAHLNYTVSASANGYATTSSTINNKSVGLDVINIVLSPGNIKTFWVKVLKASDSTIIANASVGAVINSGTAKAGGTTNAAGVAVLANLPIGGYAITVTDSGYALNYTPYFNLAANTADTVKIYMTATAVATKVLRGTVSVGSTPVENVKIVIQVGTAPLYILSATTDSLGHYAIFQIPTAITTIAAGNLTATATGYNPFSNTGAVSLAAAANTFNITLSTGTIPSIFTNNLSQGPAEFSILPNGMIRMQNMVKPGMIKVFNLKGQMLYGHSFEANTASMDVPILGQSRNMLIVRISQENVVFTKMIMIP